MLFELRSLKVKFPNKIRAVYTREGNIFYKLSGVDGFRKIRCHGEVGELEKRLKRAENQQ